MILFLLKMAWRETRAAWRHFLYFLVCVSIGVGAVTGISLFGNRVALVINQEARSLLGGDLEIWLTRQISEQGQVTLNSLREQGVTIAHVTELVAMAASASVSAGHPTQIVELKAVEPHYPLYGSLRLDPDSQLSTLLNLPSQRCSASPCYGAVVQESLLIRMGLTVGDQIKIGEGWFLITGIVRSEPDRVTSMFSLGPRVFLSQEGLRTTGLIRLGSRLRERYLLKLPASMSADSLLLELQNHLARESPRITDARQAQPQLKQSLEQLTRYLGLIGLTALFVGGIGIASSVHAFVREKLMTIGILKTIGADSPVIFWIYVLQAMILGIGGSIIGLLVGTALYRGLPWFLAALLDPSLLDQLGMATDKMPVSPLPLLKGLGLGILSSLLFALWPLLTIREVKPAWIFRREVDPSMGNGDRRGIWHRRLWGVLLDRTTRLTLAGIGVGLVVLALWQAGSWKIGWLFILSFGAAVLLLTLSARLALWLLRRWQGPAHFQFRHAIGNLKRPGSQLVGVTIAVGMGVMVMATVALVERSLVDQVNKRRPADSPSFFFIDIQPDQAEAFLQLLRERSSDQSPRLTPLVRARLSALKGIPVARETVPEHKERDNPLGQQKETRRTWFLTREYALTALQDLPKDNTIVQGEWWKPGQVFSKPLISIEEDAARELGLTIGDSIEVDIHGIPFTGEISSIRHVEWGNFSTNFYMIFSPGSLNGAPHTYVATVHVEPSEEVPLQQAVVASFPNVTAINVGDVLQSFTQVLDRLTLAIQAAALFCVLAGSLVMAAALAATRYRRLHESLILKALGATRTVLVQTFAIEYALLGVVGGIAGLFLASVLSWATLSFIFDLQWSVEPTILCTSLLVTIALTTVVGFLSTYRILGQPPLASLRNE